MEGSLGFAVVASPPIPKEPVMEDVRKKIRFII
jgi:hypothetical protein